MSEKEPVIRVANLSKSYKSLKAVDNISFEVLPGEIFGIVGPNGAGKTTTVECLMGLRRADGGEISVLGLDPRSHEHELRQRTGIQLQQAALPDELRVWEALDLFASFYRHPLDWKPLVEAWGLSEKRNARFASLSGGQKQRLFIALALVNNPELVFLDELTSGLDPQARRNTWEAIEQLRQHGKTVVLVTHFMEEAERLCDRVAIIDQGHLVALDTPQTLIQNLGSGTRLRFTAPKDLQEAAGLDWLKGIAGVVSLECQNGSVCISGQGHLLANVATAMAERGIFPTDLRTEQASLEDVFLALTGRTIRD